MDTIIIETDNGDRLFVDVYYENVPNFCSFCFYIGHVATSCHNSTRNQNEIKDMDKDNKTVNNPGGLRFERNNVLIKENISIVLAGRKIGENILCNGKHNRVDFKNFRHIYRIE